MSPGIRYFGVSAGSRSISSSSGSTSPSSPSMSPVITTQENRVFPSAFAMAFCFSPYRSPCRSLMCRMEYSSRSGGRFRIVSFISSSRIRRETVMFEITKVRISRGIRIRKVLRIRWDRLNRPASAANTYLFFSFRKVLLLSCHVYRIVSYFPVRFHEKTPPYSGV